MKNILERFDIELSDKTEWNIKQMADTEWNDFQNNGDMGHDKMPDEMTDEQKFKFAFHEGYWNAMIDILVEDAEGGRQ